MSSYPIKEGRRKVALWSKLPWEDIDAVGDESLPPGRFVSGVTGGVRFVGVYIPWRDAHVRTGGKNREPWEDHLAYCEGLGRILGRYASMGTPVCVLGDYNQRIPRVSQPAHVAEALIRAIPESFKIATAGMQDSEGANLIDHFTVSTGLEISITGFLPRTSQEGAHLSDHSGVVATLQVTN